MTAVATESRDATVPALAGIGLTPASEQGRALLQALDRLAPAIADRAAAHDEDGSFPFASLEELQGAGILAAPVPEQLGGLGVTLLHDLVVGSVRLARMDASLGIGINMHLVLVHAMERLRAVHARRGRVTPDLDAALAEVARGDAILAAAISERGQVLGRPATRATRTACGWRIDGRKIFCTLVPAATALQTAVTYVDDQGAERYAYVRIPTDAEGVLVHDDWDALGMRSSGSHSVTFVGVEVPHEAVRGGFLVGDERGYMQRNLAAGLFHAAASLGVAEATIESVSAHGRDARTTVLAAENAVDLAAARAIVARAATLIDEDAGDVVTLFAEAQAAKTFANEAAVRIADRALALSGGAGYLSSSPLARLYRDARAGAFMHPLGANRACELLGALALGRDVVLA